MNDGTENSSSSKKDFNIDTCATNESKSFCQEIKHQVPQNVTESIGVDRLDCRQASRSGSMNEIGQILFFTPSEKFSLYHDRNNPDNSSSDSGTVKGQGN